MSGFVKISLIEASGLKLQRYPWQGDNAPYVTVRAVNLAAFATQEQEWRSATALEGDIGTRWQRGTNCTWRDDAECSFRYDPTLEQVDQVAMAQDPHLEITCYDERQAAADSIIGRGPLYLGMLLCGPAGVPMRRHVELRGRRGTPHGTVVLEVCKVASSAVALSTSHSSSSSDSSSIADDSPDEEGFLLPSYAQRVCVSGLVGKASSANGVYHCSADYRQSRYSVDGRPSYKQTKSAGYHGCNWLIYDKPVGKPPTWQIELPWVRVYAYCESAAMAPYLAKEIWYVIGRSQWNRAPPGMKVTAIDPEMKAALESESKPHRYRPAAAMVQDAARERGRRDKARQEAARLDEEIKRMDAEIAEIERLEVAASRAAANVEVEPEPQPESNYWPSSHRYVPGHEGVWARRTGPTGRGAMYM